MKRLLLCLILLFSNFWAKAQQDSILLKVKLNDDQRTIAVQQTLIYHNPHKKPIRQIKLLNWVTAYQNRQTALLKRKVEDRKKELYFAKENQLGKLESLEYSFGNMSAEILGTNHENLLIPLSEPLEYGQEIKINLRYQIRLPDARFTAYGSDANHILLKYFFLIPETFENDNQDPTFYRDIEETANAGSYWKVDFDLAQNWKCYSNLNQTSDSEFEGLSVNDPEFLLSREIYPQFSAEIDGQKIEVQLGFQISEFQRQTLNFILPTQLKFIKSRTGNLPNKLFITQKFFNKEEFIGIDDIKWWKFKFQLFTDYEKTDLDYFSILSKKVMDDYFITDKSNDHWLKNGIKSYLEIQYLNNFYPNHKLLGNLPDNAKILGMKPLKLFHASDLKLTERYGLAYHYIYTQNLDQKITTPYGALSNFNTTAISQFEMGSLLNYISEYQGSQSFNFFLKEYLMANYEKKTTGTAFLNRLENFTQGKSAFLTPMINEKHRINFNLRYIREKESSYQARITHKNASEIPLKIETINKSGERKTYWRDKILTNVKF